jgi:hypothetical protein
MEDERHLKGTMKRKKNKKNAHREERKQKQKWKRRYKRELTIMNQFLPYKM